MSRALIFKDLENVLFSVRCVTIYIFYYGKTLKGIILQSNWNNGFQTNDSSDLPGHFHLHKE